MLTATFLRRIPLLLLAPFAFACGSGDEARSDFRAEAPELSGAAAPAAPAEEGGSSAIGMGCPTVAAGTCEDRVVMDNYEWNHGMGMRFGLYAVHPTTKERALRDSGAAYAEIARTRDVSPALEQTYATFFGGRP